MVVIFGGDCSITLLLSVYGRDRRSCDQIFGPGLNQHNLDDVETLHLQVLLAFICLVPAYVTLSFQAN